MKNWIVLYPVYINSTKTVAEGRRISLSRACENPTCAEIGNCCIHLNIPFVIEINKAYPRDVMQRGRFRLMLKKEDGALYNPAISSSKDIYCVKGRADGPGSRAGAEKSQESTEIGSSFDVKCRVVHKVWEEWKKEKMN